MDKLLTPSRRLRAPAFLRRIWAFLKAKKYLYPSFLAPIGVMLVVYALLSIFPFGERSILTLDMNAQYIYYFEQLRDILTGNGSLIYTWERTLGGEFLGFYTYYIASPLSLILVLFPSSLMVEAVTVMLLLKCGISGLTFSIYLDQTGKKRNIFSYVMFSTMYALCAYAMAYQTNTMWMDALMWLPLLTLGIERLVTDGRFKLFTIMLALIIWSNYYIGFMACIYTFIYFVCFICAHKTSDINNSKEKYHLLRSLARIAICSIVALLMVAMVILCAYYSISFGKTDGGIDKPSFDLRFDFLDLIAKLFIGSYDTVRPAGLPNIYCGILALFMLPVYFFSRKFAPREKIAYGVLVLVFVASMSINAIDLFWHGLNMPVWMNYRYSFMLSFIILIMAYKGFEAFTEFDYKSILQIGAGLMLLLLVIQKTVLLPRYDGGNETPTMPSYELVWISFVFIFIYMVVLYYKKREAIKRVASGVLLGVVLLEAGVGALINWGEEVNDVGWAKRESYREFIDRIEPTVDNLLESDTSFYRFEKALFRKPNENFALDIRGLSSSTSTFNRGVMELMKKFGFSARSHWNKYIEGNEVVDSIFGVRYVISDESVPVSNLYVPVEGGTNGLTIYKNPYALSIAYCVSAEMKDFDLESSRANRPYDFMEYLCSTMTDSQIASLFDTCFYACTERENCTKSSSVFTRIDGGESASFTYTVTAYNDGSIYMLMNPVGSQNEATYYVNGVEAGKLFSEENKRIHNLGTFKAGEKVELKVVFNTDKVSLNVANQMFAQLNKSAFEGVIDELNDGQFIIEDYNDTRFEGKIVAEENEIVMTTIPYDKYWQVYVDGERVETYKVANALLAFDIGEGEHTLELKYRSTPFIAGLIISLFGLALFVVMCVFEKKYRALAKLDAPVLFDTSKIKVIEPIELVCKTKEKDDDI